jgi:hypothetical protein
MTLEEKIDLPLWGGKGTNLTEEKIKSIKVRELEQKAIEEKSDIYCPKCETNLPYQDTIVTKEESSRIDGKTKYCTICDENFLDISDTSQPTQFQKYRQLMLDYK